MNNRHKYLQMFLDEGGEIVSKLYERVLRLEAEPGDREALEGALRLAHTLKGGAKMVGLDPASRAAHRLEGLLRGVPGDAGSGPRLDVPQCLAVLDEIRGILAPVEAPQAAPTAPRGAGPDEPAAAEAAAHRASERIRVSVERLDELQNLVDDLSLQKGRLGGRLAAMRKALRVEEGWGGAASAAVASLAEDFHELNRMLSDLQTQVLDLRMVPLAQVLDEFGRTVRDLGRDLGKEVQLGVDGRFTEIDRGLLEAVQGPLRHLVRNAVDHGIESPADREAVGKTRAGTITIRAYHKGSAVVIEVEDDGRGLDADAIRAKAVREGFLPEEQGRALSDAEAYYLLCEPGFTTRERVTEISGRGIGLDAVRTQLEKLKGSLSIQSVQGCSSRFRLYLPLSISSLQTLVVRAGALCCALPSLFVDRCVRIRAGDLEPEGAAVSHGDKLLPLVSLARILGEAEAAGQGGVRGSIPVVLLQFRGRSMALQVDELVDEREIILKTLGEHVAGASYVAGVSFLADEQPVPVLNVVDLHAAWPRLESNCRFRQDTRAGPRRVLIADDSLTTRHMERTILEGLGYEVLQASDGSEAWERLRREPVDALLTDVEMPRMDGLELTRRVRAHAPLARLPVVVVSNRGEPADVRAGLDAGADAYVRKDQFSQRELGAVLGRLLGRRRAAREAAA